MARPSRAAERQLDHPPPRERRERFTGTRHDDAQRLHAVRIVGGQHLRDHSAHRRPDAMRAIDLQMVEQGLGVVGEIDQRVRHRAPAAHRVARHPPVHRAFRAVALHFRRQADVAVIEADHPISAFDQLLAEAVRPHRQLGADAHDQQDRRSRGVAEVLVEKLDFPAGRRPARVCIPNCLPAPCPTA